MNEKQQNTQMPKPDKVVLAHVGIKDIEDVIAENKEHSKSPEDIKV